VTASVVSAEKGVVFCSCGWPRGNPKAKAWRRQDCGTKRLAWVGIFAYLMTGYLAIAFK
jgi:hypothetical protein